MTSGMHPESGRSICTLMSTRLEERSMNNRQRNISKETFSYRNLIDISWVRFIGTCNFLKFGQREVLRNEMSCTEDSSRVRLVFSLIWKRLNSLRSNEL